jgi:hypothetical protein
MKWKETLLKELLSQLNKNDKWLPIANEISQNGGIGIHLAVFTEPFLTAIFEGRKKTECRFSINRISPFRKVYPNDIILIKEVSGPILGFFIADRITYWVKGGKLSLHDIKTIFNDEICGNLVPDFWSGKEKHQYATFISIKKVNRLEEIVVSKNDRMSWHVVRLARKPTIFNDF